MKQEVMINGMKCEGCAQNVSERLSELNGVERVLVNLDSKNATVEANREISKEEYIEALADTKYEVIDVK